MKIKIPSKYGVGDCQIINQNKFRRYPHARTYFARNLSGKFVLLFKKKKQIYLQNIYQKNYLMHQI